MLHEKESSEETESFLKDNGKKFNADCVFVLRLLYQGKRLHGRQLETEYNKDSRRLRDIFAARKDCKRGWVRNEKGERLYVEYWLEVPKPPTKESVQDWWKKYQEEKPQSSLFQQELF